VLMATPLAFHDQIVDQAFSQTHAVAGTHTLIGPRDEGLSLMRSSSPGMLGHDTATTPQTHASTHKAGNAVLELSDHAFSDFRPELLG
jgi:hypothetical protein